MSGRRSERKPDGPEVPGYFPAAVTEAEWFAVQAAVSGRKNKGGRPANGAANVFAGLLKDPAGLSVYPVGRVDDYGNVYKVLMPAASRRYGKRATSFPLAAFEAEVLRRLREVDPRAVLPADDSDDRVRELSGRLAANRSQLDRVQARLLTDPDVDALTAAARALQAEGRKLAADLAAAQAAAASPASEAWGECGSLLDVLAASPDRNKARLRLRTALRQVVGEVRCLLTASGEVRAAAVQVRSPAPTPSGRTCCSRGRPGTASRRGRGRCRSRTCRRPTGSTCETRPTPPSWRRCSQPSGRRRWAVVRADAVGSARRRRHLGLIRRRGADQLNPCRAGGSHDPPPAPAATPGLTPRASGRGLPGVYRVRAPNGPAVARPAHQSR
jgi:hypothetical protein